MGARKEMKAVPKGLRLPVARAHASALMPYFTTGIQSLAPVERPGLGTFGVTANGHMLWDPDLLERLFSDEAATLILHEYMHDYSKHAKRFWELVKKGVLDPSKEDHDLFNDAADAEINDNLEEAGCVFPRAEVIGGPPVPPKSLGLPVHRSAEEYAITLKKRNYKSPRSNSCGSGAGGNALPDEPASNDPNGRDPVEQKLQHEQTSRQVQHHQQTRGNVPLGIQQIANATLEPPRVSWEEQLQNEVGSAVTSKAGEVDYTFDTRSRMQGGLYLSFGEEAPVLPGMNQPMVNLALVIDTSGSMGGSFERICSEAQGILSSLGGARLTMLACDAQVHAVAEINTIEEIRANLKGGGGTDFRPAFEAIEKLDKKPDVVVFATDGFGAYPEEAPAWKHIWLNVGGKISVDWGKEIKVDVDDEDSEA